MRLLEQLQDERGCLVRLGEDGNSRLLENLGTHEFAHAGSDVGIGDAAVGSSRVFRSDGNGASHALEARLEGSKVRTPCTDRVHRRVDC